MSVDEFVSMQQKMVSDCGLSEYLPVVFVMKGRKVLTNILTEEIDGDVEAMARDWASKLAGRNDYYLSFALDTTHFKVVVRRDGVIDDRAISV